MKHVNIKCPYCGSPAHLRPAWFVHGDRTGDPEARLYVCAQYPACNAYVSAHKDTLLPMGTLAGPRLRRMRIRAHAALNQLLNSGAMTRKQAYYWLQAQLDLSEEDTHIARFSENQCQQVIRLCEAFSQACDHAA